METRPTVIWQLTANADRVLSTYEAYRTIDEIASLQPARFVITDGNRVDLDQLIEYARRRKLEPALEVQSIEQADIDRLRRFGLMRLIFTVNSSAVDDTTLKAIAYARERRIAVEINTTVSRDNISDLAAIVEKIEPALEVQSIEQADIDRLRRFGLMRLIFTVNSSAVDDTTLKAIAYARERRIAVEINTTVSRDNISDLAAIVEKIEPFDIAAWNVDFGVRPNLNAADAEQVFAFIAAATSARKFTVRALEAPHYARYLLQGWSDFAGFVPIVEEKNPTLFITAAGEVRANECLPLAAGNVRYRPLKTIFRSSDLFVALRDARNLKGKCGRCDYKSVCGGSRVRAWTMTGDLFAPDPLCSYQPS